MSLPSPDESLPSVLQARELPSSAVTQTRVLAPQPHAACTMFRHSRLQTRRSLTALASRPLPAPLKLNRWKSRSSYPVFAIGLCSHQVGPLPSAVQIQTRECTHKTSELPSAAQS